MYTWIKKFQKKNQYTIKYSQYTISIQNTTYLLTYSAAPRTKNAFNEFAMCEICYPSQQNFTGCHT